MRYLLLVVLFSAGLLAEEFWTPYTVPSNRPFTSMAKAPDGKIYAVGLGVWSSPPLQTLWWESRNHLSYMGAELELDAVGVLFSDIFISTQGSIFLLPDDGVFLKSADNGANWTVYQDFGDDIPAMGEAFGKIFILAEDKLWSSEDEGQNWTEVFDYGATEGNSFSSTMVIIGDKLWFNANGKIFIYDDITGLTVPLDLSMLEGAIGDTQVTGFATNGTELVAVTGTYLLSYDILEGGWEYVKIPNDMQAAINGHYSMTLTTTGRMYVATREGVYLRTGGESLFTRADYFPIDRTWRVVEMDGRHYACTNRGIIEYDPLSGEAGKYSEFIGGGIYNPLIDQAGSGLRFALAPNAAYAWINDAWADMSHLLPPHEARAIYANSQGGALATRDNKLYVAGPAFENWTSAFEAEEDQVVYLYGLTDNGYAVFESGTTVMIKSITGSTAEQSIENYGVFMVHGNTIVLTSFTNEGKISFDAGATWIDKETVKLYETGYGFVFNSTQIVYDKGAFFAVTTDDIFIRSGDNMQTWDSLSTLPEGVDVEGAAVLHVIDNTFYVSGGLGIHRSTDGGHSWEDVTFETKNRMQAFGMQKLSDGKLYASLATGVYSTSQVPQSIEEEKEIAEIRLYPQPAQALLTVDIGEAEAVETEIYSLSGELVKRVGGLSGRRFVIDTGALGTGVYHMKISARDGSMLSRLFVKK